jgi:hypothetical protein
MRWKGSAAMSKQDHRVVVECVLRPGAMLRVLAGASNNGKGVTAGRRLGNAWRGRGRAAGEGNRAGAGEERRVEVAPAGGGAALAAERRPGAKHYRRQEGEQSRGACARGRRREERGSGGPVWKFQEFQGPNSKERFPTDIGV